MRIIVIVDGTEEAIFKSTGQLLSARRSYFYLMQVVTTMQNLPLVSLLMLNQQALLTKTLLIWLAQTLRLQLTMQSSTHLSTANRTITVSDLSLTLVGLPLLNYLKQELPEGLLLLTILMQPKRLLLTLQRNTSTNEIFNSLIQII